MARWYEGANEASFKPVAGGYVFQVANPWLFGWPRYYLVNDQQKAAIMPRLGRWRMLVMVMAAIMVPVMISAMFFVQTRLHVSPLVSMAIGIALVLIPMLLVPHLYLMSRLRPLLAGLPRTDQRFTWRDQFERTAVGAPRAMLLVGAIGGAVMMVGGCMGLVDAVVVGRAGVQLVSAISSTFFGGLLAAYFFGLLRLKAKLPQAGR